MKLSQILPMLALTVSCFANQPTFNETLYDEWQQEFKFDAMIHVAAFALPEYVKDLMLP